MIKPFGNAVSTCPKCGAPIGDSHPYSWCTACGEQLPEAILAHLPTVQAARAASKAAVAAERAAALQNVRKPPRLWVGILFIATACFLIAFVFWEPFSRRRDWSSELLVLALVIAALRYGIREIVAARQWKRQTRRRA